MRGLTGPVALVAATILAFGLVIGLGSSTPASAAGITVTVCITDSNGAHIVPGTTRYKIGTIQFFTGTIDANNCLYREFPAGTTNVEIWTTYNNTPSVHLTQNITTNPVFNFQTRKLTLKLETCGGTPLAGGTARYGLGGGYSSWFFPGNPTGANGESTAQFFPGTYSFEMGYQATAQPKLSVVIPDQDTVLLWTTTTVTIAYPGAVSYGGPSGISAWFKQSVATESKELMPGTAKFKFIGGITADLTYAGCAFTYDAAPPMVGVALTAPNGGVPDGMNGWFITKPVTGQVQADDTPWGASNIASIGCSGVTLTNPVGIGSAPFATEDFEVTAEGTTTVSCTATDAAWNASSVPATRQVKIDTIKPTITASVSAPPNAHGWYNDDVTVHFTCSDGGSGIPLGNCPADETFSAEGEFTSTANTVTDLAGNTSDPSNVFVISIDKTAPTASASALPVPSTYGWNNTDVTVTFSGDDGTGSGIDFCDAPVVLNTEGAGQSASGTCTDEAGNVSALATASGINIDKTKPTASASALPGPNANGWNKTDVTVSFSGDDGTGSGIDFCDAPVVLNTEGAGQSASGTCTDEAGNVSALATASGINIDKTAPTALVFVGGGLTDGDSYYFGSVPAGPTSCTADGSISGLDTCVLDMGYSTAVGLHTIKATATDKAGNQATKDLSYTVLAWTLKGFYQPVDMYGVWNTVKGGSTVPLKFEVFAGDKELTDVSVVKDFKMTGVACPSASAAVDAIEFTTTGGTTLRYDTVAGQFIQNWQTPKRAGACYSVTMTTQDGSTLVANFKLK